MMNESKGYKAQDKEYEEMVKAKNTLENYANEQWEMINNCGKRVKEKDKKAMLEAVEETSNWLDGNSGEVYEAAVYQEKLEALQQTALQATLSRFQWKYDLPLG